MSSGSNKWITHLIALAVGGVVGFIYPQSQNSDLTRQVAGLTS